MQCELENPSEVDDLALITHQCFQEVPSLTAKVEVNI